MAAEQRFFHWCVEFPEVFAANKGFDVMCGNPPWDKLQMEEEKWFAGKDEDIVKAANQAERKEKIAKLQTSAPKLYVEFTTACNALTSQSNFAKNSGRFPLTAVGKLELSSLFAELCLSFTNEAWGLVMPTGIAVMIVISTSSQSSLMKIGWFPYIVLKMKRNYLKYTIVLSFAC